MNVGTGNGRIVLQIDATWGADSCPINGGNAGGAGAGMTCFSPPPSTCSTEIGSAVGGAGAGKICFAAPEIDTASTASALALLTGGLLVLRGRKSGS
jgi:hypothetical protein